MKIVNRLWGHIIALCGASAFFGVVIGGVMIVDTPFGEWLHRWQTLIAGAAALFGAWLTVRKIQKQINLTRWEHGQDEIKRLNNEKQNFDNTIVVGGIEFGTIDNFARGISWNDRTDAIINRKVRNCFNIYQKIQNYSFDPTLGGNRIANARVSLLSEVADIGRQLRESLDRVSHIQIQAPPNPHADIENYGAQRVTEFARAIFATEEPAVWVDLHFQLMATRQCYLDALSSRINDIVDKYGQTN